MFMQSIAILLFTIVLVSNLVTEKVEARKLMKEVSNLTLIADVRSVTLRWNFEPEAEQELNAFVVRCCELTFWSAEIKCRHRTLALPAAGQTKDSVIAASSTVEPVGFVQMLNSSDGKAINAQFEAKIHELRALTSYSFRVMSAGEPGDLSGFVNKNNSTRQVAPTRISRPAIARRFDTLGLTENENSNFDGYRVETKPFSALASNCLANTTEVIVNTGKFFAGRISFENNTDPRCQLLGNKRSDQISYKFRIDHTICGSKLVDGNRIESNILVYENKDILTHNSARFHVVCNFIHDSFTVRAAISMPGISASRLSTSMRRQDNDNILGSEDLKNTIRGSKNTKVGLGTIPDRFSKAKIQSLDDNSRQPKHLIENYGTQIDYLEPSESNSQPLLANLKDTESVVMSNNHRVAQQFIPIENIHQKDENFSFRYSISKTDNFETSTPSSQSDTFSNFPRKILSRRREGKSRFFNVPDTEGSESIQSSEDNQEEKVSSDSVKVSYDNTVTAKIEKVYKGTRLEQNLKHIQEPIEEAKANDRMSKIPGEVFFLTNLNVLIILSGVITGIWIVYRFH